MDEPMNLSQTDEGVAGASYGHRIESIDLIRGVVILLMALDYFRDFFAQSFFEPTDPELTTFAFFFTRWITHFCAPAFLFLAGTSAALMLQREKSASEVALFLLKRGFLLIVLELTVISFGWNFTFDAPLYIQVIFALGASMILLSGLIFLPPWVSGALGLAIIFGVGLLPDLVSGYGDYGGHGNFWHTLWLIMVNQSEFKMGPLTIGPITAYVIYPAIPWFGAMALGFALGSFYRMPSAKRHKTFLYLGLGLTVLFVILRFFKGYGDPSPWEPQSSGLRTVLSFLNASKYPPSTLFMLMTLGPFLIALTYAEKARGAFCDFLITFGRVPLFFYVLLIYVAHMVQVFMGIMDGNLIAEMLDPYWRRPENFGVGLFAVYVLWVLLVGALYPLCRWYGELRFSRHRSLLSYF